MEKKILPLNVAIWSKKSTLKAQKSFGFKSNYKTNLKILKIKLLYVETQQKLLKYFFFLQVPDSPNRMARNLDDVARDGGLWTTNYFFALKFFFFN